LESDVRSLLSRGLPSLLLVSSAASCTVFESPLIELDAGPGPVGDADDAQVDVLDDTSVQNVDEDTGAPIDELEAAVADSQVAVGDGALADTGTSVVDTGVADAGPPSCVIPSIDAMDVCSGAVVINEVDGSGDDFVEIYNRSDTDVNISGWLIADDSGGSPDVAEGAIFPPGTVLPAHRFVYVWSNLAPEPGGNAGSLFMTCIPSTPPPCLHSQWGVTAGGERLFLLNADLTVVCAVNYPNAVFGGEAFGRIPDGSEQLCPTKPSAGNPNVRSTLR
jgi:hypothetical protein